MNGFDTRPRVLVVSPSLPEQPSWGFARRVHHLTQGLALDHDVAVLAYRPAEDAPPSPREQPLGRVRFFAIPSPEGSRADKRLRQVRSLVSRVPFHAGQLRDAAMQRAFDDLVDQFDVVLLESSQVGWLKVPAGVPVVVDEHNIESELLGRMAGSEASTLRRTYNRWEHLRYRAFERRVWAGAAACTTTSKRDADAVVERCPDQRVTVVPNGVDPEEFRPTDEPVVAGTLVFTGLLSYRPNLDGITWFLTEVWPKVHRERPQVRLTIVGDAPAEVLDSLRRPGVTVTGWVTDVRPHIDEAAVAIVPLRVGGGTRLKVVEAMSMAKAIVSTSLGSEGLDVVSGTHLELADDPDDFADAVISLLDDPARADRLGAAARVRAVEKYSWSMAARTLGAVLQEVARPSSHHDIKASS